jgi:hypothetical protein
VVGPIQAVQVGPAQAVIATRAAADSPYLASARTSTNYRHEMAIPAEHEQLA